MRMILMGLAAACAISASPIGGAAGQPFRDCPRCPEMVAVPTGTITIGSPENEERAGPREDQVAVTISRPFAVGRFAATRDEFAAFVSATGHKPGRGCYALAGDDLKRQPEGSWLSPGFAQDGRHPVVCFAWHDAKAYVAWLTARTGKAYRLLSEAEREYVTRAGTTTPFWWGATISTDRANYNGTVPYGDVASGEWRMATVPVDSFAAPPGDSMAFTATPGTGRRIAGTPPTPETPVTGRPGSPGTTAFVSSAVRRGTTFLIR